ncbi:MAG: hypothetical protein ACMG6E_05070, partial [Candidatus Roizmanbacteria bacterium]
MNNEPGLTRRDLLRITAAAAVGVALNGSGGESRITSGIFERDNVRYLPMYEEHDKGPDAQLNPQASGLFMETIYRLKVAE